GQTTREPVVDLGYDSASVDELLALNEGVLEKVYPTRAGTEAPVAPIAWDKGCAAVCGYKAARPRVVIPVFPGTNCEYDTARACQEAGMDAEIIVIRNLSREALLQSALELESAIQNAQIVVLPGGFSG